MTYRMSIGQHLAACPGEIDRGWRRNRRREPGRGTTDLLLAALGVQGVADAGDGDQVARLAGVELDLLPQAVHQLLDPLAVAAAAGPPDGGEQALGRQRVAGGGTPQAQP